MMPKYALIRNTLVENVILVDRAPAIAGRTVVDVSTAAVSPGDSYDGTIFTPYQPTIAEIERRDMPQFVRARLPQLRAWSQDAKSAAEITAMTAAERIARQAQIEDRIAKMARVLMGLVWQAGQDDGS